MNFVKRFKTLPTSSQRLMGLGVVLALAVALPLFVWAIITQNFNPNKKASGDNYCPGADGTQCSVQYCPTCPSGQMCPDYCSLTYGKCNNNICILPTPTPTPTATPIPNLQTISIKCANNGTTAGISWTTVQNAVSYNLQLDYKSNNSSSCQDGWYCSDPPDKLVGGILGLTKTVNTINNSYYAIWVDSVGSDSGVLNRSFNYFVCNGSVTETSSPTPTATPVSTGAPNSCNGTCGSNYNCAMNYFCFGGFCRNPNCVTDATCGCATPKPAVTARPSPTPEIVLYSPEPVLESSPTEVPADTLTPSPTPIPVAGSGLDIRYIAIGLFAFIALIFGLSILIKSFTAKKTIPAPINQNPESQTPPDQDLPPIPQNPA